MKSRKGSSFKGMKKGGKSKSIGQVKTLFTDRVMSGKGR